MLVLILNTTAGTITLPYDTDKIDVMLGIMDALSVTVISQHPRYVSMNY